MEKNPNQKKLPKKIKFIDLMWPEMNHTREIIKTYDSADRVYVIKPGERIMLPKQLEFIQAMLEYDATLYGGAVGGGKSHALRWALIYWLLLLAKLGFRDIEVGLFCETFAVLEDRQIKPSRREFPEWLGTFNQAQHEFILHECYGSGRLCFRNLDEPKKYASSQFAAAAFDEITKIDFDTFDEISHRVRWKGIAHCPIIAATNPGSKGHIWVRKLFVDPRTRVKKEFDKELNLWTKGYHFIQALPRDNPFIDKNYYSRLKRMDPHRYQALVLGDWNIFEGQVFDLRRGIHIVPELKHIPDEWLLFRALDHGLRHPEVCLIGGLDFEGTLWIFDEYSCTGKTSERNKEFIYKMCIDPRDSEGKRQRNFVMTVGDPSMFRTDGATERNKTPAEIYNREDDEYGSFYMVEAPGTRGKDAKKLGIESMREAFSYEFEEYEEEGQVKTRVTRYPKIRITANCKYLIESLSRLTYKEKGDVEDVQKPTGVYYPGEGDDEADALRYMWLVVGENKFNLAYQSDPLEDAPGRMNVLRKNSNAYSGASVWAID